MKIFAGDCSINAIRQTYKSTPRAKFWNPLYWLQVLVSWPMSIESMNKYFSREKIYCMFDNMKNGKRLVINARCVPDAGFLWARNPKFTKLRLGRVFGKVSGTFMNEIFIHFDGEEAIFNMVDGTYEVTKKRANDLVHHPLDTKIDRLDLPARQELPELCNDMYRVTLHTLGYLILSLVDRGIGLGFKPKYQATITEENARGAIVSKKRVVEVKEIDTILDI